jgi:hypothetical protein
VVLQKLGRMAWRDREIVAATEWLFETLISDRQCGDNHNCHHPRRRMIQYSKAVAIEPRGCGVLDRYSGSLRKHLLLFTGANISQPGAREIAMAKGQMRSNKEKKKPKANKNIKKGGATPSPFSSGKTPAGQSPNSKK